MYQSMSLFHVGALKTSDDRYMQVHGFDDGDESLSDGITSDDTSEDVDEDGGDLGISGDEGKCLLDRFCRCSSTNV